MRTYTHTCTCMNSDMHTIASHIIICAITLTHPQYVKKRSCAHTHSHPHTHTYTNAQDTYTHTHMHKHRLTCKFIHK